MREGLQVLLIKRPLFLRVVVVEPTLQLIRRAGLVIIVRIGSFLLFLWPESLFILLHDHIVITEAGEHPRFHASINGVSLCQGI
jgi:hypothetical protein